MPSHAVWSLWAMSALRNYAQQRRQRMPGRRALQRRIAEAGYTLLLGSSNYDLKEELRQVKALAAQAVNLRTGDPELLSHMIRQQLIGGLKFRQPIVPRLMELAHTRLGLRAIF
jgi:hypothetical protein